jgi:putative Ca2+/H+ antiporter (TMEM165/GDT1 family)
MTILSVLLGQAASFLPKQYIHYAEILFFLGFGVKLIFDAWKMPANAEEEIVDEAKSAVEQSEKNLPNNNKDFAIILETFILTFLAEWGDRTQIATIALAASNNPFGVTIGAIVGHTICALIAVLGGKLIAGRISEKTITFIGGGLFILFGVVAMFNPK